MGAYAGQVGTRNVARDLEAIRIALGEPKLDYLGYSYGTIVGITYAQMFPTTIRTMVLDGPPDYWLRARDYAYQQAQRLHERARRVPRLVRRRPAAPSRRRARRATCCSSSSAASNEAAVAGDVHGQRCDARRGRSRPPCSRARCCRCSTTVPAAGRSWPTPSPRRCSGARARRCCSSPTSISAGSPDGTWQPLVEANAVISCVDRPAKKTAPSEAAELADVATLPGPAPAVGRRLGDDRLRRHAQAGQGRQARRRAPCTGAPPILVIGHHR